MKIKNKNKNELPQSCLLAGKGNSAAKKETFWAKTFGPFGPFGLQLLGPKVALMTGREMARNGPNGEAAGHVPQLRARAHFLSLRAGNYLPPLILSNGLHFCSLLRPPFGGIKPLVWPFGDCSRLQVGLMQTGPPWRPVA